MSAQTLDAQALARENELLRDQQRALARVLRTLSRWHGLQAVLDEVVEEAIRLCVAGNGRLWLLKDGLLHVASNRGDAEGLEYDAAHPAAPDRTSMAGRAALTRAVVHIPDIDADPEYTYSGPRPFRSGLHVPILLDGELIGVIGITRAEAGAFEAWQIDLLATFGEQAAIAIANARLLATVERQRAELARFLSPQVADLISSDDGERLLAGHRAYVTCLFCDLRGFTAFAETAAPEELFEVLGAYHALVGRLLAEHHGTLEHFAGDGVMVFFNDPLPLDAHELWATRFALAAHEGFAPLQAHWRKRGIDLALGVGLEAGYATLGRIGFEGRYDYGAVGPVANLASRLSTTARGGQTLIGRRVAAAVEDAVALRPVGELELKGFARPVAAYEVAR